MKKKNGSQPRNQFLYISFPALRSYLGTRTLYWEVLLLLGPAMETEFEDCEMPLA